MLIHVQLQRHLTGEFEKKYIGTLAQQETISFICGT